MKLHICVCTYNRTDLLSRLIADVLNQSITPHTLIIVDGAPDTDKTRGMLVNKEFPSLCTVLYIPSNHGNLAYQRYLGWRASADADILLYLDDDLRIVQRDAIEKTILPLTWQNSNVVGVTARIIFGKTTPGAEESVIKDRDAAARRALPLLVKWFGAARSIRPGGLSAAGHRVPPIYNGKDYETIQWLRGGVMAFNRHSISQDHFSDNLFALTKIRCGLGEDTFLSHNVQKDGDLLMAFNAVFEHPNSDAPKSYPTRAFLFGHATSYSRRLLNDNYHGLARPQWKNRLDLVKSYLGTAAINWLQALLRPRGYRFAYSFGYTVGAIRGLLQKPTARNLTPKIEWWYDAEQALLKTEQIS